MIACSVQKPVMRFGVKPVAARRAVLVRSTPKQDELDKKIGDAIAEAQQVCSTDDKDGCASAWDTVEELSAEKAHEKAKAVGNDPLEQYCNDEPDADECRVHDV